MIKNFWRWVNETSLVKLILVGIILGILLAVFIPQWAASVSILGTLFVNALKAVAPVLVFVLVMAALATKRAGTSSNMRPILVLYIVGTFVASLTAVAASFLFPTALQLQVTDAQLAPPSNIIEVIRTVVLNIVDNPVHALMNANYIGILAWASVMGIALRQANDTTKQLISDFAQVITQLVQWVLRFAPLGIFGLVASTIAESGFDALIGYVKLLSVLLGCFFFIALVMNPLIAFVKMRINPYPLVLTTLRESGLYAFFTRSSAANIPVNMNLCQKLGLDEDTYSVSIPLGATINMAGAAITIAVLTLSAVHTLQIPVDFATAFLLCVISAVGACGASGVAGGSLLLIPLACSLFGISNDIAMQVVGVGFIIGVLQDSCETALNSSSDVLFTAVAEFAERRKEGRL